MRFKDLSINDKFIIPITPDIGKTLSEVKVQNYLIKYIKVDDKKAYIINSDDNINQGFQGEIEIPEDEHVILLEKGNKDE